MVTGADAMVTGIGHWCWTQAMVTGSLVDDGLDIWISGNWWYDEKSLAPSIYHGNLKVPDSG